MNRFVVPNSYKAVFCLEKGSVKMKISEVKELLAGVPTPAQLEKLRTDERSGVQKLLTAYDKRLAKEAAEKERFYQMLAYERRFYDLSLIHI